jgi:hypothetical protein
LSKSPSNSLHASDIEGIKHEISSKVSIRFQMGFI